MNLKHSIVAASLALFCSLAVLLAAAPPPAPGPAAPGERYQYARISPVEDTFVLVTADAVYRVELPVVEPPVDPTVYRGNMKLSERRFDRRLYALNVFAAEGWEIEPGADLKPGEWYLVRRRR